MRPLGQIICANSLINMIISALLGITILGAALATLFNSVRMVSYVALASSTIVMVLATIIGYQAITETLSGVVESVWYMDAFAGLMILLIGFIQWTATMTSVPYLLEEEHEGLVDVSLARRYFFLLGVFVFSMFLAVTANNIGFVWVALEATTLATTLLVAFYAKRKGSLEAAWKYLVICSTGISLGLLGILIIYFAAATSGFEGLEVVSWSSLPELAPLLPATMLKVAFVLIFIGFGTKIGLVPMHTWLPDAHSRAPSPISGMLSGVVLNVALFSVLRYKGLLDGTLGSDAWTSSLFIFFGVLSVAVPAAFIIVQADYKRLLAYSSIEHMGLIVVAIGLGGFGAIAGVVHMIGHALAKSGLFFAAGNILLAYKSTKFESVHGVMRALPYTGSLFLILILALLAIPGSPLFLSEYLLVLSGITTHPYAIGIVLISLAIIFAGFITILMPMLFTRSHAHTPTHRESWNLSHTAISLNIVALFGLGIWLWSDSALIILTRITSVFS